MHNGNPEFLVATGPMFSSKTTWLLMHLERFKYQNKRVAVFKPRMDNRYSTGEVVSHAGWRTDATLVTTGSDILEFLSSSDQVYDVIAVDEEFMVPGAADALIWLFQSGFTVLVSTLDISASGKPFKEVEKILPWATKVEKCTAVCTVCGSDARYTHKKALTPEEAQSNDWVAVGGAEMYEPRCFKHHVMIDRRPTK